MAQQQLIPFGPIRNSELFSNHWLQQRLHLEPEWNQFRDAASAILNRLADLWKRERASIEAYGEHQLEQAFIQPAFRELGWVIYYQTHLESRQPDYALFTSQESLEAAVRAGKTEPQFWQHPTLVADAKAWPIDLDRPVRVESRREYPPEQIEWYIEHSNLDYGILTNGRLWRLFPRKREPGQPRFQTYVECDLASILQRWASAHNSLEEQFHLINDFLQFYLFFSPIAFKRIDGREPLVVRARLGSSEYRVGVGEGLKDRVFEALRLCIEGFLTYRPNNLQGDRDLPECRAQSFILLYRLLFIMYAEDRQLLPYRKNESYTRNRALARHRDEIAARLDRIRDGREDDYAADAVTIYPELVSLFDLINNGKVTYDVPRYNGGLFDPELHPFLEKWALPDHYAARVIDQLGRALVQGDPDAGLARVDYRDLAIQHLGTIYEGLLELQPRPATEPMVVVRKITRERSDEKTIPARSSPPPGYEVTEIRYKPGQVYLENEKGERRASGSYYTPNHIVDYIVEKTLGPICEQVDAQLNTEIQHAEKEHARTRGGNREEWETILNRLRADFDDRILKLRLLDPAMGSGHFLLRACQYLAEQIATNPNTGDSGADHVEGDESTLVYWKRRVVENCLYGVDLNAIAVELAKLALWLETVAVRQPLTFLDHHLHHGNSLVGARIEELASLPEAPLHFENTFKQIVVQRLPVLLEPLARIRSMHSDTVEKVKEKEKLYRKTVEPVRDPLRQIAHLWCSHYFTSADKRIDLETYHKLLHTFALTRTFNSLLQNSKLQELLHAMDKDGMACFHWELEFPEVFLDKTGRNESAGFNAVIGNPPYDVLSSKETKRDVSALQRYLDANAVYQPSFGGKNNLYKLFICRALDLLAEGGRLGFITPMAVLGDEQAVGIRKHVLSLGAFSSTDAFPQKDDPNQRVFREAKLSTAVFTTLRTSNAALKRRPFTSRVHPANVIEPASPSLQLSTDAIPLYDPGNLTIVSCAQTDWDLAVKINTSSRMRRLGDYVRFFQGEVNETNERANGNLLARGTSSGKLVTRGSNICLYVLRDASQGDDIVLNVKKFLEGKNRESKAFHHEHERVGVQESCPQNNFRRIIAAAIPAGEFCNHKVNYVPEHTSKHPVAVIAAMLNSKLCDWYFRLGSTNAAVSHYQLYNLPCPAFREEQSADDRRMLDIALAALRHEDLPAVLAALSSALEAPPFSRAIRDTIIQAVGKISDIEASRGEIARTERSHLAPAAQPYQDLIDQLIYRMAGLNPDEIAGLEVRLEKML